MDETSFWQFAVLTMDGYNQMCKSFPKKQAIGIFIHNHTVLL